MTKEPRPARVYLLRPTLKKDKNVRHRTNVRRIFTSEQIRCLIERLRITVENVTLVLARRRGEFVFEDEREQFVVQSTCGEKELSLIHISEPTRRS